MLTLEKVTERERIWPVLAEHWGELLRRTGETSPFLSEPWIEAWLSIPHAQLATTGLLWRNGSGTVVGCALLSVESEWMGPVPLRRSFLNATGGVGLGGEHNNLLSLEPHRREIMRSLVDYQLSTARVDEFSLEGAGQALFQLVVDRWPTPPGEGYESESPYVSSSRVHESGGEYLSLLSRNTRGQIRRSIRLYDREFGPPRLEFATTVDERLSLLEELVDLHERRWNAVGSSGAFSRGRLDFHRNLIARLAERACGLEASFCRVRFGDTVIGLLYHLVYRDRVYFYQSGFRYDDEDPRLKPGLVTHALAIQRFADEGLLEYDFLGGEPEPVRYKRSLSTGSHPLYWVRFQARSVKMRLIENMSRVRHRLRGRAVRNTDVGSSQPRHA